MRMRRMKNLEPRMEKCSAYRIAEPAAMLGKWRTLKPDATALWVEVGCGKGKFTAETAQAKPDVLLIAVERCREAMVVAMEKAKEMGLTNVFYIDMDVEKIEEIFAKEEIDRLFINFHFLVVQLVKNPPAMQETWVQSLGWEDSLQKEKAIPTSIFWPGEFP